MMWRDCGWWVNIRGHSPQKLSLAPHLQGPGEALGLGPHRALWMVKRRTTAYIKHTIYSIQQDSIHHGFLYRRRMDSAPDSGPIPGNTSTCALHLHPLFRQLIRSIDRNPIPHLFPICHQHHSSSQTDRRGIPHRISNPQYSRKTRRPHITTLPPPGL
jgi:hypothetical protein